MSAWHVQKEIDVNLVHYERICAEVEGSTKRNEHPLSFRHSRWTPERG